MSLVFFSKFLPNRGHFERRRSVDYLTFLSSSGRLLRRYRVVPFVSLSCLISHVWIYVIANAAWETLRLLFVPQNCYHSVFFSRVTRVVDTLCRTVTTSSPAATSSSRRRRCHISVCTRITKPTRAPRYRRTIRLTLSTRKCECRRLRRWALLILRFYEYPIITRYYRVLLLACIYFIYYVLLVKTTYFTYSCLRARI